MRNSDIFLFALIFTQVAFSFVNIILLWESIDQTMTFNIFCIYKIYLLIAMMCVHFLLTRSINDQSIPTIHPPKKNSNTMIESEMCLIETNLFDILMISFSTPYFFNKTFCLVFAAKNCSLWFPTQTKFDYIVAHKHLI